jgi:hypothetical protein
MNHFDHTVETAENCCPNVAGQRIFERQLTAGTRTEHKHRDVCISRPELTYVQHVPNLLPLVPSFLLRALARSSRPSLDATNSPKMLDFMLRLGHGQDASGELLT